MLVSRLNVFNLALLQLGKEPVLDVNANTIEIAKLREVETFAIESLLQASRWDFAVKKTELTFIADYTNGEFSKLYSLPNDCLEIWRVYDLDNQDIDYAKVDQGLTSDSLRVFVEYTKIMGGNDYGKFDATFCEALAFKMAGLVAPSVQHSDTKTDYINSNSIKKQGIAASKAVGRGSRTYTQSTTWLNGRNFN